MHRTFPKTDMPVKMTFKKGNSSNFTDSSDTACMGCWVLNWVWSAYAPVLWGQLKRLVDDPVGYGHADRCPSRLNLILPPLKQYLVVSLNALFLLLLRRHKPSKQNRVMGGTEKQGLQVEAGDIQRRTGRESVPVVTRRHKWKSLGKHRKPEVGIFGWPAAPEDGCTTAGNNQLLFPLLKVKQCFIVAVKTLNYYIHI